MKKLEDYLNEILFYSAFLRLGLQSYFELCIITFLIYYQSFYFDGWKAYLNTIISIPIGAFLIILPFAIFLFFRRNKQRLFEEDFSKRYNTLYENESDSRPRSVYFIFLFLLRRLIYALSI